MTSPQVALADEFRGSYWVEPHAEQLGAIVGDGLLLDDNIRDVEYPHVIVEGGKPQRRHSGAPRTSSSHGLFRQELHHRVKLRSVQSPLNLSYRAVSAKL